MRYRWGCWVWRSIRRWGTGWRRLLCCGLLKMWRLIYGGTWGEWVVVTEAPKVGTTGAQTCLCSPSGRRTGLPDRSGGQKGTQSCTENGSFVRRTTNPMCPIVPSCLNFIGLLIISLVKKQTSAVTNRDKRNFWVGKKNTKKTIPPARGRRQPLRTQSKTPLAFFRHVVWRTLRSWW